MSRWERVEESQPGVPTSADVDVTDEPQAGKAAIGEGVQAQTNPPRQHRGRGRNGGYQAQVPSVPEPGPSRFRPTGGDGAPPEPHGAIDSEALYRKQVVSTMACRVRRTMLRPNTTKSRPSSRRRRVSQPPPITRAPSERIRCRGELQSPSLQPAAKLPLRSETRSMLTPVEVPRVREYRPEHTEPGDATVGHHGEPHVGEAPWIVDLEDVVVAAPQRRRRHELDPIGLGTLECPPPG